MDSGRGHMEALTEELYEMAEEKWPKKSGVFRIGEEIEIKEAWFKVKKINNFGIMLKAIKSKPKEQDDSCNVCINFKQFSYCANCGRKLH